MEYTYAIEWRTCSSTGQINPRGKKAEAIFKDKENELDLPADYQAYLFARDMDKIIDRKIMMNIIYFNGVTSKKWKIKTIEDLINRKPYLYKEWILESFETSGFEVSTYQAYEDERMKNKKLYAKDFLKYYKNDIINKENKNNKIQPNGVFLRIVRLEDKKIILDNSGFYLD